MFFLFGSEAGAVTQLADLVGRNNVVQVVSTVDTYASTKNYTVPVDSSMTRLTVSVSGTLRGVKPVVTLTQPNGVVITAATATSYLNLSSGVIISIDNPPRGAWTLAIGGSPDQTYVNVNGIADLAFSSFKLARFGAMPPHQGLLVIDGEPGPGQALYAVAALTGIASAPQFQLRRKNVELLSPLPLEQDRTDNGKSFGALTVPNEAFVAYATGADSSGFPYQRL